MFGPWLVAGKWLGERLPKNVSALKPSFNFITLHYLYLVVMTIIGSIIIYGSGEMPYIDALFFASGSATQSGLNTIDINTMKLYQQVAIMLITCLCTPIFINTFVVFVRLYWFEKRFQNVAQMRSLRHGRTMSQRKGDAKGALDQDVGQQERGLGDPSMWDVHRESKEQAEDTRFKSRNVFEEDAAKNTENRRPLSREIDPLSPLERPMTPVQTQSNLVWADKLETPAQRALDEASIDSPSSRLPRADKDRSIALVEKQRNPKEKTHLRIPGPRDFDRGEVPEEIREGEQDLHKVHSKSSYESEPIHPRAKSASSGDDSSEDNPNFKNHITIDVPDRPRGRGQNNGPSVYNRTRTDGDTLTGGAPQLRNRSRSRTLTSFLSRSKEEETDPMPYLSWTPTLARNSNFVDLTEDQREELGGIEYRALKLLAIILVCYFVGFHLLGMVCLTPWIVRDAYYSNVIREDGVNPVWWGFFTPASMFNDLGFTLNPDSMISFQFAVFPLVLGTFLIIIGNTGFPCMLRFVIWLCSKIVPRKSGTWEELRFLLDHPRRCFTLLFPSKANWWLFWVLIGLNGIDLIFFIILDLNDPTVTSLPPGFRFLCGLFQAAATRTAGFAVVNIADLHPAIQVSYLIMMYISIFPIAMSMRRTNVYEEKSLGIFADSDDTDEESSFLSYHLRRQLSFDLWFVFLGFFLIAIIEGDRLENNADIAFSLFSVLFEIVSAYGTVGLSLGYPGVNTSFSGQFRILSKLIIIAMQIRGRHRGLPYALDRAILLPSESLHQKENEDATRRARRNSSAVGTTNPGEEGLMRTGTGLSRKSSLSIKPRTLQRIFSGAFSAGPSAPPREKKA